MSDFFGKLKSGAGKVAFEADKFSRLNRAKGELEQLKRQIDTEYARLGELYYHQHSSIGTSGPAYDEICQAIVQLEQQVSSKNDNIESINAETYTAQTSQPPVVQPAQPTPIQFIPPSAADQDQATAATK